jgi:hypothetical protein
MPVKNTEKEGAMGKAGSFPHGSTVMKKVRHLKNDRYHLTCAF